MFQLNLKKISGIILIAATLSSAGVIFSIRPGIPSQGMQLGFGAGKTVSPFIGLDYAFFRIGTEMEFTSYDYYDTLINGVFVEMQDTITTDIDAKLAMHFIVPGAGMKINFTHSKLSPYLTLGVSYIFPIATFSYKEDGEDLMQDADFKKMAEEMKDNIRSAITTVGISCGFGVEYFFADAFSVGGEFSLNLALNKMNIGISQEDYLVDIGAAFGITQSKISFNYYF